MTPYLPTALPLIQNSVTVNLPANLLNNVTSRWLMPTTPLNPPLNHTQSGIPQDYADTYADYLDTNERISYSIGKPLQPLIRKVAQHSPRAAQFLQSKSNLKTYTEFYLATYVAKASLVYGAFILIPLIAGSVELPEMSLGPLFNMPFCPDSITPSLTTAYLFFGAATSTYSALALRLHNVFATQLNAIFGAPHHHLHQSLPNTPLTTKVKTEDKYRQAVNELESQLRADPDFLAFLGYDHNDFNLLNELQHIKILDTPQAQIRGGFYFSPNNIVGLVPDAGIATIKHEFLHALHAKAMRRKITFDHIKRLKQHVETKKPTNQHIIDCYETMLKYYQQDMAQQKTVPSQQTAMLAENLLYCFAVLSGKSTCYEAIADRYIEANNAKVSLIDKATLSLSKIYAFLGGFSQSNMGIKHAFGYNNSRLLKEVMQQDVVEMLMP